MLKNKIQITVMENGRQRAVGARVGLTTTTKKNRGTDRIKCYGQYFIYIIKLHIILQERSNKAYTLILQLNI